MNGVHDEHITTLYPRGNGEAEPEGNQANSKITTTVCQEKDPMVAMARRVVLISFDDGNWNMW